MRTILGAPPQEFGHRQVWTDYCRYIGMSLLEVVWLAGKDDESVHRQVILRGEDHIREALSHGNGALLLFSHFGNPGYIKVIGTYGYDIGIAARPFGFPSLDRSYQRIFDRHRARWIPPGKDMLVQGKNQLGKNGLFAVAIDFSVDNRHSSWAKFGPVSLWTNHAPIALALRCGSPILYAAIHRLADGRHTITITPLSLHSENPAPEAVAILALECLHKDIHSSPHSWWLWGDCRIRSQESPAANLSER